LHSLTISNTIVIDSTNSKSIVQTKILGEFELRVNNINIEEFISKDLPFIIKNYKEYLLS